MKDEHSQLLIQLEQTKLDHETANAQLDEKLGNLSSEKERIQTEFEQRCLELTQEKEKLEAIHNENQSEIDLLASQLQEKTATLIDFETTSTNDIQGKEEEIKTLKGKIEELEKEKEVICMGTIGS